MSKEEGELVDAWNFTHECGSSGCSQELILLISFPYTMSNYMFTCSPTAPQLEHTKCVRCAVQWALVHLAILHP